MMDTVECQRRRVFSPRGASGQLDHDAEIMLNSGKAKLPVRQFAKYILLVLGALTMAIAGLVDVPEQTPPLNQAGEQQLGLSYQ